jgi:hypothetical protein
MDPEDNERYRLEGYLPKNDFHVWLELGLGRVAFMEKDWSTAEKHYENVITRFPESKLAPEAVYYRGVSRYSVSHDSAELATIANQLSEKYSDSEWQLRSIPWLKEKSESTSG